MAKLTKRLQSIVVDVETRAHRLGGAFTRVEGAGWLLSAPTGRRFAVSPIDRLEVPVDPVGPKRAAELLGRALELVSGGLAPEPARGRRKGPPVDPGAAQLVDHAWANVIRAAEAVGSTNPRYAAIPRELAAEERAAGELAQVEAPGAVAVAVAPSIPRKKRGRPVRTEALPFGFFITYKSRDGSEKTCGRIGGYESNVRAKMRQLPSCVEVVSCEPLDRTAYIRTFGYGKS